MKYVGPLCFTIYLICIGAIGAYKSKKKKKSSLEYTDKSFVVHLIMGIPMFPASIYYLMEKPNSGLILVGTIIVSGAIAFIIGLHYERKKAQWEKKNDKED